MSIHQLHLVCKHVTTNGSTCCALQVEAEEVPDITERYTISMVPHFLLFKVLRLPLLLHGLPFHLTLQKPLTHCHALHNLDCPKCTSAPQACREAWPEASARLTLVLCRATSLRQKLRAQTPRR